MIKEAIVMNLTPEQEKEIRTSDIWKGATFRYIHQWCLVKGCTNTRSEGKFVGDICAPCHEMLTTGKLEHTNSFLKDFVLPDEPEHKAADGTTRKSHYGSGKQPWDLMIELDIAFEYALGCVLKYVRRDSTMKGVDREADLKKARWYAERLKEFLNKMDLRHPKDRRKNELNKNVWGTLTKEERELSGMVL